MLEAFDKLRRWSIDPSKHLQSDLQNLILLVQRVNEISKYDFSETSILAIIFEAISRDHREELRMIATCSSRKKQKISELMQALSESHGAQPYNCKNVKMHEFQPSMNTGNRFHIGKYPLGEKCKFKHEVDPEFKKKEVVVDEKKKKDNNKCHREISSQCYNSSVYLFSYKCA